MKKLITFILSKLRFQRKRINVGQEVVSSKTQSYINSDFYMPKYNNDKSCRRWEGLFVPECECC